MRVGGLQPRHVPRHHRAGDLGEVEGRLRVAVGRLLEPGVVQDLRRGVRAVHLGQRRHGHVDVVVHRQHVDAEIPLPEQVSQHRLILGALHLAQHALPVLEELHGPRTAADAEHRRHDLREGAGRPHTRGGTAHLPVAQVVLHAGDVKALQDLEDVGHVRNHDAVAVEVDRPPEPGPAQGLHLGAEPGPVEPDDPVELVVLDGLIGKQVHGRIGHDLSQAAYRPTRHLGVDCARGREDEALFGFPQHGTAPRGSFRLGSVLRHRPIRHVPLPA